MFDRIRWPLLFTLSLAMALLLMLTFTGGVGAETSELSLEELTEGADVVVIGSVVSAVSFWNADGTRIYTEVAFSIEHSFRGPGAGSTIAVIVPGGTVGPIAQRVSDTPRFAEGDRATLYLSQLAAERMSQEGLAVGDLLLPLFELYGPHWGELCLTESTTDDRYSATPGTWMTGTTGADGSGYDALQAESSTIEVEQSGFVYNGMKWFGDWPVVDYKVKAPDGDSNTALQNAASSWSNAGAQFSFNYAGTHTRTGGHQYNGVNEIMWVNLGSTGPLARAIWWYYSDTGEIVEADMEFNTYNSWSTSTPTPSGSFDVETVALHEFGHWLSLGHSDIEEAIMWPYYKGTQHTLHDDDIAGIRYIYDTVTTYTISGTILDGEGIAVEGVSVAATGGHEQTVTSNEHGYYELTGVAHGAVDITITPAKPGYTFEPVSRTVAGPVEADVLHQDFTATAMPWVECTAAGTFESSRYQPGTWSYDISITRTEAGELVSGTIVLTAPDTGVIEAEVLAIKCDYGLWYNHPDVSKPNFAATGTATYGAYTGSFIFLIADSHIQMVLSTADYSAPWEAETLWSFGDRDYDIWSDDGGFWVDCLCPPDPVGAGIDPDEANYALNEPGDLHTTITWNDATSVVSIHDGTDYLTPDEEYTIVGDTLTVLNAYLAAKLTAAGQSVDLTIAFDILDPVMFRIIAIDASACETSGTFTSKRYQPGTWSYDISITRDFDGVFLSGTVTLTAPDLSVIEAEVLEVKCNYGLWYNHPDVSKPNFAATGTATYGAYTGNFIFLIADSHIQMVLSTADYSAPWEAETLWSFGDRDYDIWSDDGDFWVDCLCPVVTSETEGTLESSRYQPGTWSYDISITRTEADGVLVDGTITLTAPDLSVITGTVQAVKCDYGLWYNHPAVSKPNFAATGTATYGAYTGNFIFLIADSHIQMVLSTADYSAPWEAETLWSFGDRDYDIWSDDGGFWVDCLCP